MGRDNLKSLGGDGEIGLPEISGRHINIEDSRVHPAKDACKLCREKDKVVVRANDLTSDDLSDVKNREYTLISESGLYRILAKCNLPKCEPWFVAKDVATCIEHSNVSKMCELCRDKDIALW